MKSSAATLGLMILSVLYLLEWSVVSGSSDRDRLFRDITRSYLKYVEPDNAVLKVKVTLSCARHDETKGILTTNAVEELSWSDKRLSWNPKVYGDIQTIRFPWHMVWIPDIKLFNSITAVDDRYLTNVIVYYNGTVLWAPSVRYQTPCSRNSTGTGLKCRIEVGSWSYDSDTVKLGLIGAGVSVEYYWNSTCPLTVDSATAVIRTNYDSCCTEPISNVEINLLLKPQTV